MDEELDWTVTPEDIEAVAEIMLSSAQLIRDGKLEAARSAHCSGHLFRLPPAGKAHVEQMTADT